MERSLSKTEARIILDLEWRGQKTVTLAELSEMLGAPGSYARKLAHVLVSKGWLERLRPGLFRLIPADRGREGIGDTNPLAAGAVLIAPYFFSFGTACTYHGITEQVFAEVYIACRQRRRAEKIRDHRYVFIHVPEHRFYGYEEVSVLGEPVEMATLERALLDALDRPRYAGGIGEVSRIAARAAVRVSWDDLIVLAGRWGSSAIVQRLGYLLDLQQVRIPDEVRVAMLDLVRPRSKILLGPRRRWGTTGRLVRPWNVVENVPRDVLLPREEGESRPVVFSVEEQR